jgi:epsilon-lactone hydrolase
MASVVALDQWRGGIVWEEVKQAPRSALATFKQGLGYRLGQWAMTRQVRAAMAAHRRGPEAFTAFLAKGREWHDRYDRALMTMADAEAVRVAPPPTSAPPPIPSDWFAPRRKQARGILFYVHGGSFVAERSPRITQLVTRFAAAAGASVFAPSYRLAPEHPCPAAVDDIVTALRWFREEWPDEPVVALAESAGSAILLAALQIVRDDGDELPNGVVLLSPWIDLSLQSWSIMAASIARTSPHTMESLGMFAQFYLQGRSPTDPLASPIFGSFEDFPPMLIHASRSDILYDDSVRLAERVREADGHLTVRHWADETHVWERMNTPGARDSIRLAADFIRQRLDA